MGAASSFWPFCSKGVRRILGIYIPSAKNSMVTEFYPKLGFTPTPQTDSTLPEGSTAWELDLETYVPQTTHIKILEFAHA